MMDSKSTSHRPAPRVMFASTTCSARWVMPGDFQDRSTCWRRSTDRGLTNRVVDREPYEANFRYRLLSRTQSRVVVLAHAGLLAAERYLHVSDHAIYKFSLRLNGVQSDSSCCILEILARVLRDLEVVRRVQVVDHRVQVPRRQVSYRADSTRR